VGKASITNLLPEGRAQEFSLGLGSELRRRRLAARLSQDELSRPLTRAFISQVEHGVAMPSLPALIVISERLGTSADEVLKSVNQALNSEYPVAHADRRSSKSRG
jgi:transcriptional regulator with XRE-family HTH domain